MVVDEDSARLVGSSRLGLACDHFRMSRFFDAQDANYCFVKEALLNMVATSSKASVEARKVADVVLEDRDISCLNAIFSTDPRDDLEQTRTIKDSPLPQTSAWVFENEAFKSWYSEPTIQTLWIHGGPGKGKTMLCMDLIEKLRVRAVKLPQEPVFFFLCDSEDERRNSAIPLLRGLVYLILCHYPQHVHILRAEHEKQKNLLLSTTSSLFTLWRILHDIIAAIESRRITIIIDGLDECSSQSMHSILTLLGTYIRPKLDKDSNIPTQSSRSYEPRLKLLLLSRDVESIRQHLEDCKQISLETNADSVDLLVQSFINRRLDHLQQTKHYDRPLRHELEDILRAKAGGTFLWVALACRELASPKVRAMHAKRVISRLPSGIKALYNRIVGQILSVEDELDAENVVLISAVLRAMTVAFRPLKIEELGVMAGLPVAIQ